MIVSLPWDEIHQKWAKDFGWTPEQCWTGQTVGQLYLTWGFQKTSRPTTLEERIAKINRLRLKSGKPPLVRPTNAGKKPKKNRTANEPRTSPPIKSNAPRSHRGK